MKEQLITYETAKLAKEKGFNIPCWNYYGTYPDETDILNLSGIKINVNNSSWGCNAPTQSLLQKWLREEYNIDVLIVREKDDINNKWIYCWEVHIVERDYTKTQAMPFNTYEEALEKGLQEALKLIKEQS